MLNDTKQPAPLDPRKRHYARQYVLQALYQKQMADTPTHDIESEFLRFQITKDCDLEYFKDLLHGIAKQLPLLDEHIKRHLSRPLAEMDMVELAVLRLATYELLQRPDVPYPVVINEALQLTKKFGSVEGYKFVNGVLDKVAKETRKTEKRS